MPTWSFLGLHLPMDGYGYATMKLAPLLAAKGARVVDMCDLRGQPGRPEERRYVLDGRPALLLMVPEWLPVILSAGPMTICTMFESTRLPPGRVELMNRLAARVVVPCQWNREVFSENGVTVPISVVPWGIDRLDYWLLPRERTGAEPYTFLWSGTPDFRKGWDVAYRAFRRAFGDREDVRLVMHFRRLPAAITRCGDRNVELVDGLLERPRQMQLLQQADCFVFPSRGEGWGLPPREAAATGLPAIATQFGGLAEEIAHWGIPLPVRGMSKARFGEPEWGDTVDIGEWAEPDEDALVELYRHVERNRAWAARQGRQAATWLAARGWQRTADGLASAVVM